MIVVFSVCLCLAILWVWVYVCEYGCVWVWLCVCVCVCVCVCMCVCVCACVCANIRMIRLCLILPLLQLCLHFCLFSCPHKTVNVNKLHYWIFEFFFFSMMTKRIVFKAPYGMILMLITGFYCSKFRESK